MAIAVARQGRSGTERQTNHDQEQEQEASSDRSGRFGGIAAVPVS
jgi:hypothetical protein